MSAHDVRSAPMARVIGRLAAGGYDPRPAGSGQYTSRCPGHQGQGRNLTIKEGADGRVLLHCHRPDESGSTCPAEAIVAALGLEMSDLFPPKDRPSGSQSKAQAQANGMPRGYPTAEAAIAYLASQIGPPTASWTYHLAAGTEQGRVVRFDPPGRRKEFRPIHCNAITRRWQIGDPPGPWPLYRLPELGNAPRSYFLEGEKCCDLARSLGLIATTTAHGARSPHKTDLTPMVGREVVLLPDVGPEGEVYATTLLGLLAKLDPRPVVKIVRLPGLTGDGDDIEEWIERRDTRSAEELGAEIERLADAAPVEEFPAEAEERADHDPNRPTIVIECLKPDDSLGKWTAQALDAMERANHPPRIFQRGGSLCRVLRAEVDGPLSIITLSEHALRGVLDRIAYWGEPHVSKKGKPWIKYGPPRLEIVRDFASLPGWNPEIIPPIVAIIEAPRFLPDGRMITRKGYYPEIRTFYDPPPGLENLDVPPIPRPRQVAESLFLIFNELFVDFPFADHASKANALAVMLLPFVRELINGPTPLHMFEASTEGTGKGKLANACAYPALGYDLTSTPQKEDESEWRKSLTTTLMRGTSHIFIDNMYNPVAWNGDSQPVTSGVFASALTQPVWGDRILGGNKDALIRIKCIWMASGNNIEWSKELVRRVVPIRLTASIEDPCERTGFKHDPLEDWIRANRRELLRACLILCQNWIAQGRPMGRKTMGSFEHYARVMGGILDTIPVAGFLDNLPQGKGKDRESVRWPSLVKAWYQSRGGMVTTAAELHDLIFGNLLAKPPIIANTDLQVAFADLLGDGKPLSQKQKLGHALGKQEGRIWGKYRIVRSKAKIRSGVVLYKLVDPNEPFSSDDEADDEADE